MATSYVTSAGTPAPAGISWTGKRANFSVYCRQASRMELLLYRRASDDEPFQVIVLDPARHREHWFWHVAVHGLPPGTFYNWRVTRLYNVQRDMKMR